MGMPFYILKKKECYLKNEYFSIIYDFTEFRCFTLNCAGSVPPHKLAWPPCW